MKSVLAIALSTVLLAAACDSLVTDGAPPPEDTPREIQALTPGYYTISATANHMFVAAENAGAQPLVASRSVASDWEEFTVVDNGNGTISLAAKVNGKFVAPQASQGGALVAASAMIGAAEQFTRFPQADGTVALKNVATGKFVCADLDNGARLMANRGAVGGAWETFTLTPTPGTPQPPPPPPPPPPPGGTPDFGPNVLIFDPSMSASSIQTKVSSVFSQMESNQYGEKRYALVFKPGAYSVDVNVGFFTQVLGLGLTPDQVTINGAVHSEADWFDGNATQNFWRSVENLAIQPSGGTDRWAVSQASPFRRVHVRGSLALDDGGWSSGGFIADSVIDQGVNSGTQQQWFTRSSKIGWWSGSNWNMVFTGVQGAPSGTWPNPPYTVVGQAPVVREKPFLYVDAAGHFQVFVPAVRTNSAGPSWSNGAPAGTSLAIETFYIAKPGTSADSIDAALAAGQNVIFTPGVFHLSHTLHVNRAGTVVLGLGLATLLPDNGAVAMQVADVDGVKIAGLLFDAGPQSSPVLLEVGPSGSSADHSADPTSLHDLFFRVGGSAVGKASVSLKINSNHVIGDHFWLWRGDHTYGVGWGTNTAANGLVVNGNDVTVYGLFVEHYQQHQTLWNGNRGRVYFYQSEIPYDVPSQGQWMNGGTNGFASYKVGAGVTSHEAWGLGIYSFFSANPSVKLQSAIEAPGGGGVKFHDTVTVALGGKGEITHIVNSSGGSVNSNSGIAHLTQFP